MDRWIIVGLGNPGRKYRRHRHNAGFQVVDAFSKRAKIRLWRRSCRAHVGKGVFDGIPLVLAKPQTYMNRSGESAALLLQRFRISPDSMVIVHDDLDLEKGRIKLKRGGGHGGHNGLRSIMERCGTDFIRLRIGIGRPEGGQEPADYVLEAYSDLSEAGAGIDKASDTLACLLRHGLGQAMNRFH